MVCESCEFEDHFLRLFPDVSIILNVDADHLEYFKNIENIIKSFHKFATMASKAVIYNGDDANTLKAVEGVDKEMISFGWDKKNDYSAVIKSKKACRHALSFIIRASLSESLLSTFLATITS